MRRQVIPSAASAMSQPMSQPLPIKRVALVPVPAMVDLAAAPEVAGAIKLICDL